MTIGLKPSPGLLASRLWSDRVSPFCIGILATIDFLVTFLFFNSDGVGSFIGKHAREKPSPEKKRSDQDRYAYRPPDFLAR